MLDYWNAIGQIKHDDFVQLDKPEPFFLEDVEANELVEYSLLYKSRSIPWVYVGERDLSHYYIELLRCDYFDKVKEYRRIYKSQRTLFDYTMNVMTRNYQFTSIGGYWIFLLITPIYQYITLEECNFYLQAELIPEATRKKISLNKDTIVRYTVFLLSEITNLHANGMRFKYLSPDTFIMIFKKTNFLQPLLHIEDVEFALAVDVINSRILKNSELNTNIYPDFVVNSEIIDLWGLGVCLYAAISRKCIEQIPKFGIISEEERMSYIKELEYIPGITELVSELLSDRCAELKAVNLLFSSPVLT